MKKFITFVKDPIFYAQIGTFAIILAFFEYIVDKKIIADIYLAAPSQIVIQLFDLFKSGSIFINFEVTMIEFVIGYIAAVIIGIGLGILMARIESVEIFLNPFVSAFMAIPAVALIPILLIWFGIGIPCKAIIAFNFAVFPILFNTITGVKETPSSYFKIARAFGASKKELVRKIILPSAVPTIFTGLRLAASRAMIGALFAEMYSAEYGLGNIITRASSTHEMGQLFAVVLIVTVLIVALIYLIEQIEKTIFSRWKYAT